MPLYAHDDYLKTPLSVCGYIRSAYEGRMPPVVSNPCRLLFWTRLPCARATLISSSKIPRRRTQTDASRFPLLPQLFISCDFSGPDLVVFCNAFSVLPNVERWPRRGSSFSLSLRCPAGYLCHVGSNLFISESLRGGTPSSVPCSSWFPDGTC